MPLKKGILLLFTLCICLQAEAQTTVKGFARGFPGKEIQAFYYDDYITYTRHYLESDTISPEGLFSLTLDLKETRRVYLLCDHLKAALYAQPGKIYPVLFPVKDSTRLLNQHIDQDGDLDFNTTDTTDLNTLIIRFNIRFDEFWKNNYQHFVLKQMRAPLDSFRRACTQQYAKTENAYFHSYVDYSIASTRVSTLESEKFLSRDYLEHKPIQYASYEYMVFFNQFFDKAFYQFAISPKGGPVYDALNVSASFADLLTALKPAPYLENDTLRELYALKGLYENYNNREFKQSGILSILEQATRQSKVAEHRRIARNIITHFTQLKKGSPAPAFSLPDLNGKPVKLSDFKGKYVYLSFGASWCTSCIGEWKMMEDFQKKYPLFRLVTIITDDQVGEMKKLIKQNPHLNWTFLCAGNNEQVKHDYNIFSVPYHFLISPSGKIILSPAPGPADGLEEIFYKITQNKQPKVGEW